jgi:hypothetical protein
MRRPIRSLLVACLSVVGVLAATQHAVADAQPAAPYRYDFCYPSTPDQSQWCFSGHGVVKFEDAPSGNYGYVFNGQGSYDVSLDGQVIYSSESRFESGYFVRDGEGQTYRSLMRGSATYGGMTCSYDFMSIYSSGEVRHQVSNFVCS